VVPAARIRVNEMDPLGLVELQRTRDAVDYAVGNAGRVAAFELGVVLARNAG
jgi:hypothetical protein